MNIYTILQYVFFLGVVLALVIPLGWYMQRVFDGEKTWLDPVLRPVERIIYRVAGVNPTEEMDWKGYSVAFVLFGLFGTLLLHLILRIQPFLHTFDPAFQPAPLSPDLAMNTAISFSTTTTWQAYGGETTMSYFSQMVGLAAQNFMAGAAGLAVGIAFIRGLTRQRTNRLGNFWVDVTRASLWVLLPIAVIGSLLLVWQGVPVNFLPYQTSLLLQTVVDVNGNAVNTQTLPMGPVAALELIKNLGTNGGGYFNVNGAHPFANPTPLTNLITMWAIILIPAALTYTFGRMAGQPRQGWLLFWVMLVLFVAGLGIAQWSEQSGNPRIADLGVDISAQGNMEGKETRFGVAGSVLTAITTSNGATGSYNSMHDSYMPLGGAVPLVNLLLGEIIFGGLGTGLYSVILIALVGLFVGGLMVGRTPEYLGKKISIPEMKLIVFFTLIGPLVVMPLTALAVTTAPGLAGLTTNSGAHGFTEILYAYATSVANNGQNFAGLSANSPFYNITTALAMMIGRFVLGILALTLAGLFASQTRRPATPGTMPTDTPLFGALMIATVIIVGALSYFPAIALGAILEHLLL
ncbi:MAG TPA: potassium-transporting ATPase subunit KdpA [Anaerolineales bacterium]|nr:potassium-transporting ATPase subunit KdpA [Anaerolineales bacterium]